MCTDGQGNTSHCDISFAHLETAHHKTEKVSLEFKSELLIVSKLLDDTVLETCHLAAPQITPNRSSRLSSLVHCVVCAKVYFCRHSTQAYRAIC